ncbi:ABC transporter, multidrug resistance associated protein [Monoraphidium neglectum]|uniref:ABC transporter, multidrug resistance associated protein n=1 Tax=Monoraphidium neglectum TaxID=145388 RepID=A0A0D2M9A8_9CHLO|nr:ABC transporter, multidrug resistance associated protein [Monoraphidium neglectum]KIY99894.1 ABC transporter, multidrug resistance associated protein [Monoraphidium neglectum]|eukprot:XP_013898914.1 ABC transporter, multidrug resistance associated protein [Monoraphidium neglectum]
MESLLKGQVASLPARNVRNDNFLQRLFLTWVYAIVGAGRNSALQQEALCMPADQAAEAASEKFLKQWAIEQEVAAAAAADKGSDSGKGGGADGKAPQQPSLARALWRSFGLEFALAGVFKLLWSGFVLLGASYFVNALIQYVQGVFPGSGALPQKGIGWVLSCSFFADSILAGLALQRMGDVAVRVGIKARAALITAVYRKSFRLNSTHGHEGGNIVSLVSTDCIKLYEGVQHCHNVWTAPLEAATIIGLLLWRTGGAYGLPALGVVLVVLPLQYYFGYKIAMYKMANVEVSDGRVLRMHEILLAIKLVKFYVWERSFAKQVEEIRDEEIRLVRASCVIKTANLCLVFAVPPVIALVIFATYAYAVGPLTPAMAFVVLSLFNTLRFPLVVLPKALRGVSEGVAALGRLQKFLLLPESEDVPAAAAEGASIEGAELHFGNPEDFVLKVPRFDVAKGEVVAIVGRVGSGKSSVLQALLSKMTATRGTVHVGGGVTAYVPQSPWVQNLTLRENILFGLPYDEARYKRVIHACALELDLKILPNGDQSIAGERGINLSGGQRQRLALARAAYHDADVVLLDNPLSAVDQHTSKHIFDFAIKGLLKDKAVVLIAHQLELLPQCTKVGIMKGGEMIYFGPPDAAALQEHMPVDSLADATVEAKESATAVAAPAVLDKEASKGAGGDAHDPERQGSGDLIKAGGRFDPCKETPEEIAAKFSGTAPRLTARRAAFIYWRSGGLVLGVVSLAIFAITQTTRIIGDWWIRSWAADHPAHFYRLHPRLEANALYLAVYAPLVALFIALLLVRDGVFSAWSVRASTKLHNQLFRRVLSAPILFFLRTPVGDVLNAFARDQDTLDETLPDTLHMTGIYLMILLTSLAIVTVSIHYYAIMTGALFLSFFMMQYLYLPAATVLKRWAGETASGVFVHVDESLHGMDVIRAFGAVDYFIQENVARLNRHHLALFNTEQTHLWLAFWCDFFGAVLVVATCLFSVAFSQDLGAANVGLAISNSIQVLVFFTWVVRGVADSVSMWDAVERVTTFATQVPSEQAVEGCPDQEEDEAPLTQHRDSTLAGRARRGAGSVVRRLHTAQRAALEAGRTRSSLGAAALGPAGSARRKSLQEPAGPAGRARGSMSVRGGLGGGAAAAAAGAVAAGPEELRVIVVEDLASGAKQERKLAEWPASGDLRFERVSLRYFPGGPLALRGVTFHVNDCEKIGVVGRTGSGKTTLLMALFRLLDLAGGRVLVDGADIATLPLKEVRFCFAGD